MTKEKKEIPIKEEDIIPIHKDLDIQKICTIIDSQMTKLGLVLSGMSYDDDTIRMKIVLGKTNDIMMTSTDSVTTIMIMELSKSVKCFTCGYLRQMRSLNPKGTFTEIITVPRNKGLTFQMEKIPPMSISGCSDCPCAQRTRYVTQNV